MDFLNAYNPVFFYETNYIFIVGSFAPSLLLTLIRNALIISFFEENDEKAFSLIEVFLFYCGVLKRVPHNLEISLQGPAIAFK